MKSLGKLFITLFTEMKGFEPLRRGSDLPHFECGPFNHLGTSPVSDTSHMLFYSKLQILASNIFIFLFCNSWSQLPRQWRLQSQMAVSLQIAGLCVTMFAKVSAEAQESSINML